VRSQALVARTRSSNHSHNRPGAVRKKITSAVLSPASRSSLTQTLMPTNAAVASSINSSPRRVRATTTGTGPGGGFKARSR
jgi:hypothetical protein